MITNDKAFDMLPHAVDIFEKLDMEKFIKDNTVEVEEGDDETTLTKEQGMKMVKYVVRNANKVKEEVFNIVAISTEKTVDEVRKDSVSITINTFKEILQDEELMGFFSQGTK